MVPVVQQGVEKRRGGGIFLLCVLVVSPLFPPATNQATEKDFVEVAKSTEQMATLTPGTD